MAGHATTAAQGRILLRRQFAQLPRWLGQARYNGPPPTHQGTLLAKPRDYASNPQISADGSRVAFETYRQKLDDLLKRGEIAVETRDVGDCTTVQASPAALPARPGGPQSSYNATISGDGKLVAFESAAGNRNFGKRYGDIGVFVRDLSTEQVSRNLRARQKGFAASRSAWGPALSADGRHVVYQAVDDAGRVLVRVADLTTGDARTVVRATAGMTPFEPDISADGGRVAYTAATPHGSRIEVVDVATGETTRGAGRRRRVRGAARPVGRRRACRLRLGRRRATAPGAFVSALDGSGATSVGEAGEAGALRPVTSADGGVVAYTEVTAGTRKVMVRDVAGGTSEVVSRARRRRRRGRPSCRRPVHLRRRQPDRVRLGRHQPRRGQARRHPRRLRARRKAGTTTLRARRPTPASRSLRRRRSPRSVRRARSSSPTTPSPARCSTSAPVPRCSSTGSRRRATT